MKFVLFIFLTITVAAQSPQEPVIPAEQADVYKEVLKLQESNPQEALRKIDSVKEASPAFDLVKAVILRKLNRKPEAGKALMTALKKMPSFYQARKLLGYQLLEQNKYDDAIHHFLKVIQLGRADGFVWQNVASCYIIKGKLQAAEEALRQLRLFSKDDRNIDKTLLTIRVSQKDFSAAYKISSQLVDTDQQDRDSWRIMINALIELKKEDDALQNMILYSKLFKLTNEEKNLLAGMYYNEGFFKDAAVVYANVEGTLMKQAKLQSARCYISVNDFKKALAVLKPDRYTPGEFSTYHSLRADCYEGLNKEKESLTELLQVLKYDTDNGRVNFRLAEKYEKSNPNKAQDFYNRAAKDQLLTIVSLMRSSRLYALNKELDLALRQAEKADQIEDSVRTKRFLRQIKKLIE